MQEVVFDTSFIAKDRTQGRRHGCNWTAKELENLSRLFQKGHTLERLAYDMERSGLSVALKLAALGHLKCLEGDVYVRHVPDSPELTITNKAPSLPNTVGYPARWLGQTLIPSGDRGMSGFVVSNSTSDFIKEKVMSANIETKVFIDGTDASKLTDEQIFTKIANLENAIENYSKLKNRPKKLEEKVAAIEQDIKALIAYVDLR